MPEAEKPHRAGMAGASLVVISGIAYCTASTSMVLLNKHALASFGFTAPISILCFQCTLATLLVKMCELLGFVTLQPFTMPLVRVWYPVNLIFVAMILTSFFALKGMGVGMLTVWKNMANVLTATGDYIWFNKTYSWHVWAILALMVLSALVGARTDAAFSWAGYGWIMVNCVATSAYALYLRGVMDTVSKHTTGNTRMDEFSMVMYNNMLSIPPLLFAIYVTGEHHGLLAQPALRSPVFLTVCMVGGLVGFAISFTSLWFLSQSTATIYSLVGSLNKVPVAMLGMLLFRERTSPQNLASIGIALGAGVLLTQVKRT